MHAPAPAAARYNVLVVALSAIRLDTVLHRCACRLQGSAGEAERLRGQLAEAQRENHLLKRAVAIQNARMQELRWAGRRRGCQAAGPPAVCDGACTLGRCSSAGCTFCGLHAHCPPAPPPCCCSGKEAELAQLRSTVEGFQAKVHALEVQNYSLALHLRQATDGKDAMSGAGFGSKNPDVF